MDAALIVAKQCVVMLIYMFVGAALYKGKKISKDGNVQIARLLMTAVIPCLLVDATQVERTAERTKGFLIAIALGFAAHVVGIVLERVVIGRKDNSEERKIAGFGVIYSNAGFMAIPLIRAAFGEEAAFYAIAYLLMFNALSWTQGVALLSGGVKGISLKRMFLNPGVIGVTLSVIFYLTGVRLPELIAVPVSAIAGMNTPLAMIICGIFAAQANFKECFKNKMTYIVGALRLLIIPITVMLLYKALGAVIGADEQTLTIMSVSIIAASCPVAVAASFMPAGLGMNGEKGSGFIVTTTLVSMITIPVLVYVNSLF